MAFPKKPLLSVLKSLLSVAENSSSSRYQMGCLLTLWDIFVHNNCGLINKIEIYNNLPTQILHL